MKNEKKWPIVQNLYDCTTLLYGSVQLNGCRTTFALVPFLPFNSTPLINCVLTSILPIFILLAKTLIYEKPNLLVRFV